MKVTKEQALQAQKEGNRIMVYSDTYPSGLHFHPWEGHTVYFVGHNNITYEVLC